MTTSSRRRAGSAAAARRAAAGHAAAAAGRAAAAAGPAAGRAATAAAAGPAAGAAGPATGGRHGRSDRARRGRRGCRSGRARDRHRSDAQRRHQSLHRRARRAALRIADQLHQLSHAVRLRHVQSPRDGRAGGQPGRGGGVGRSDESDLPRGARNQLPQRHALYGGRFGVQLGARLGGGRIPPRAARRATIRTAGRRLG